MVNLIQAGKSGGKIRIGLFSASSDRRVLIRQDKERKKEDNIIQDKTGQDKSRCKVRWRGVVCKITPHKGSERLLCYHHLISLYCCLHIIYSDSICSNEIQTVVVQYRLNGGIHCSVALSFSVFFSPLTSWIFPFARSRNTTELSKCANSPACWLPWHSSLRVIRPKAVTVQQSFLLCHVSWQHGGRETLPKPPAKQTDFIELVILDFIEIKDRTDKWKLSHLDLLFIPKH